MKKSVALLLAALLLVLPLAACGDDEQDANEVTVYVLGSTENTTLNPYAAVSMEAWVRNALFDTLLRFDSEGNIQPHLAESFIEDDDGVTITFNLRRGLKAHDGSYITAEDVYFSFNTMFSNVMYYWMSTYMSTWEIIDEYTFMVRKALPYFEVLNLLAVQVPIVPKAAYEERGEDGFAEDPIGTGPFTFVSSGVDNTVTMRAFPDYWNGRPDVDNLVVRSPMDMTTAVVALERGEIDIITNVPSALWSVVQANQNLVFSTTPGWSVMTLCFMNALSHDRYLRKAIYHGVNRENAIIFGTENTAVEARDVYSARTMRELSGAVSIPGFDVELAREYLAQSDYVPGTPIRLTVSTPDSAAVAQSIQNDMNQIGITINIEQVEAAAFGAMMGVESSELDMFLSNMGLAMVSTFDMLLYWESDNPQWGPQIATSDEFDELARLIRLETDRDRLNELALQAIEIQYYLANHLGIYESLFSIAHTSRISGIYPISAAAMVHYPGDLRVAR